MISLTPAGPLQTPNLITDLDIPKSVNVLGHEIDLEPLRWEISVNNHQHCSDDMRLCSRSIMCGQGVEILGTPQLSTLSSHLSSKSTNST